MLTKTGYCIDDIGGRLSWSALDAFLHKPDLDSEIARELEPELTKWVSPSKTNAILADIYDILAMINSNLVAIGSGKRSVKPKPYPRPNDKEKQHIGKNALPISEFDKWLADKRAKHKASKER